MDVLINDYPAPGSQALISSLSRGNCFRRQGLDYVVGVLPGSPTIALGFCLTGPLFEAITLADKGSETVEVLPSPHFGPSS